MTVLVTYASKHGSTQGIAEAIGDRLRERGLDAEVRPVREVKDLERYDTVVLGSAVYLGAWLKEAQRFLDRHEEDAPSRAALAVQQRSDGRRIANGPRGLGEAAAAARRRSAPGTTTCSGALDPKDLSILERTAIKAAKSPIGDFRDWSDIERWADSIADG